MLKTITIAHSPDPDDAFMFYALTHGLVRIPGVRVRHVLKDIATLNRYARRARYEVTAVSAAAFPALAGKYRILSTGTSMGNRYGPILVAPRPLGLNDLPGKLVAVPGLTTTACWLLRTAAPEARLKVLPFDRIIRAVARREVAAGVLIHEGQLTYRDHGLHLVAELGAWWYRKTGLPIPLGLDVVRADLGPALSLKIRNGVRGSIRYAFRHERDALAYALKYGRGLDAKRGKLFVKRYVDRFTLNLGPRGRLALRELYIRARRAGLLARIPRLQFV